MRRSPRPSSRHRRRHWVWYILVGAVAHFVTHWPQWSLSWVLLADVANIARALTAAVLLRWLFDGPPRLDSVRALALFVVSAAIVAPGRRGHDRRRERGAARGIGDVWPTWSAWFMSNALTGLTILPAFVLAVSNRPAMAAPAASQRRRRRGGARSR